MSTKSNAPTGAWAHSRRVFFDPDVFVVVEKGGHTPSMWTLAKVGYVCIEGNSVLGDRLEPKAFREQYTLLAAFEADIESVARALRYMQSEGKRLAELHQGDDDLPF